MGLAYQPPPIPAAPLLDAHRDDLLIPVDENPGVHREWLGTLDNGVWMPARYAARVFPRDQKCADRLVQIVAPWASPVLLPGEAVRYRRSTQQALFLLTLPVPLYYRWPPSALAIPCP